MYILHVHVKRLFVYFLSLKKSIIGSANIMQYVQKKFLCLFPISHWAAPIEMNEKKTTDAKFSSIWQNRKSRCSAQFRLIISKGFYALSLAGKLIIIELLHTKPCNFISPTWNQTIYLFLQCTNLERYLAFQCKLLYYNNSITRKSMRQLGMLYVVCQFVCLA